MTRCSWLLVAILFPLTSLDAQPIEIGETISLRSAALGEERSLMIFLPESYSSSTFRYPVLYLLDGGSDFTHTAGIVEFLAGTDQIPELIVVGVKNTNRSRDLTPPSGNEEETAFWDEVGGADLFRRFIREELVPFIDERYRTEPYRIIRGQSFGGLFAVHDYMSAEPIFDAYLTSSPAVGWNFEDLIERAPAFFALSPTRPLFVGAAGKDFPGNLASIQRFASVVDGEQPDDTHWAYEFFPEERHYSLVHRSTYSALRFLYKSWQPSDEVEAQADFIAYEKHYTRLSEQYGYTIQIPMQTVIRLGNQLLRQQRYDEGIEIKKHNLELYPDHPDSYWHVADAYVLAGRLAEAKPFFKRAYAKAEEVGSSDVADYRLALEEVEGKLRAGP